MSEVKIEPKPQTKRISDLDQDEEMVQNLVLIPEKYMKKLDGLSLLKETSKGAIVREALKDYFEKQDRPIETPKGAKVSDQVLDDILRECTTYWGNFDIEGTKGFIAITEEKGIKLKDLTEPQFEKVAEKLEVGYKGYAFKPSVDEFIGKFSVLEPTEKQKDILREKLGEEKSGEHSREEEEDEWDETGETETETEEDDEW